MRAIFVYVGLFLACSLRAVAADPWIDSAWKCYEGGGFGSAPGHSRAETVPLETFSGHPPNPRFKLAPGDMLAKFLGMSLSPGTSITSEVITTYQGHNVYCFTCEHKLQAGEPDWTFDWVVLAGDVSKAKGPKMVRIFYTIRGDQVRDFSASALSSNKHAPGLEIEYRFDGNGMEIVILTMDLTKNGPVLAECTESARKQPIVTYHFNKAGKVIKVEKEDKE